MKEKAFDCRIVIGTGQLSTDEVSSSEKERDVDLRQSVFSDRVFFHKQVFSPSLERESHS